MVRLRLMRMGKKKQPTYRIVAADSRSPRNGRFIEIVGIYEPRRDPSLIEVDNEKAVKWLRSGAKPSERVERLLKISGAWDDFKGLPAGTSIGAPPEPGRRAKAEAAAAGAEGPSPSTDSTAGAPQEAGDASPADEPDADEPVAEAPAEAVADEQDEPDADEPVAEAPAEAEAGS